MRRRCTESELKLLKDYKKFLCSGKFKKAEGSRIIDVFISLFAGLGLFVFTAFLQINMLNIVFQIVCLLITFITFFIISSILKINRISKAKKRFLRNNNLEINKAVIVGVNNKAKKILYMEDGQRDKNGQPYIVEYPACYSDLKGLSVGDSILVLYEIKKKTAISS